MPKPYTRTTTRANPTPTLLQNPEYPDFNPEFPEFSRVSGLITGVFPLSVPNPEYPGLYPESPGFLPFLPPKTEILISGKTNPQIETLLDPSRVIHKKMIDPKEIA